MTLTVTAQLDAMRAQTGCALAAYLDLDVCLVLASRAEAAPGQERLDALARSAATLFALAGKDVPGALTLFEPDATLLLARMPDAPGEAIVCQFDRGVDVGAASEAMARVIEHAHEAAA